MSTNRFHPGRARRRGAALVVTLAMVMLLTFAVLTFFMRATSNRKVESLSTARVTSEVQARSILDALVADLRKEMIDNSDTTGSDAGSPPAYYVLRPNTAMDAVPKREIGSNIPTVSPASDAYNNLIKQSVKSNTDQTYPSVGGSTAIASLSGRTVGTRSWNLAQLIGDESSLGSFAENQLPDWVLVTREGINTDDAPSLTQAKDSSPTNGNYVIGRFAYNIYDVGGLIDINAAGFPNSANSGDDLQILQGSLAGVDLSLIPGIDSAGAADALVAWRNASSQAEFVSGTSNPLDTYVNYVSQYGQTNGFLKPWSGSASSDQRFLSRQDLIRYAESGQAGIIEKALPFLTTFSRDLDQPSFAPDPGRPRIKSNTSTDNYAGNDAANHDDEFNPDLLTVRVKNTFTRNDDTTAVVGEPLLKKRFALNRLAWLTYKGPSAGRSLGDVDMKALTDAGLTQDFLLEGTANNILKYFGLTWNSTGNYWVYDHDIRGSANQPIIGYMAKIQAAAREPDFFEILKAAINAGAIAKGATNPARSPLALNEEIASFVNDTKVDFAILQIGANIIDQFDADGYPTRIRFDDGTGEEEFRGNENLPYFYRVRSNLVVSRPPSPAPALETTTNGVVIPVPEQWDPATTPTNPLIDTGFFSVFWLPEVWNPYDVNSSLGNPRPSNFRIVADSAPLDPDGSSTSGIYNPIETISQFLDSNKHIAGKRYYSNEMDTSMTPASYNTAHPSSQIIWDGDNTALNFGDNSGTLFREPTLLYKPNTPSGSNLQLGPNNILRTLYQDAQLSAFWDSANSGVKVLNDPNNIGGTSTFIGFYYGQGPLRWITQIGSDYWIFSASQDDTATTTSSASAANTFRVQYSDNGSTWTTYDEKYVPHLRQAQLNIGPLSAGQYSHSQTSNLAVGRYEWATSADPRTRRFGNPGGGDRGSLLAKLLNDNYALDSSYVTFSSDRPDTTSGYGWYSSFKNGSGALDTAGMPEVGGWYPTPATAWVPEQPNNPVMFYHPGLLSQNNPNFSSTAPSFQTETTSQPYQYYTDPDGVARRAMGAFATASSTVGLPMAKTMGNGSLVDQNQSRPIVLNRPFRSVAELSHVFSGTPWKNLSVSTPESGFAALLDVFTIQNTERNDALVAGKVNLNSRQDAVIAALLAGARKDAVGTTGPSAISESQAEELADLLVSRTTSSTKGPLRNISELAGRWQAESGAILGGVDGSKSYDGFSADIGSAFSSAAETNIQRYREAPIRALASVGTVRVWNLLIDVVLQTGRYPSSATSFADFDVQGEQHCWLHVAIDRYTGDVLDQQLEIVRE